MMRRLWRGETVGAANLTPVARREGRPRGADRELGRQALDCRGQVQEFDGWIASAGKTNLKASHRRDPALPVRRRQARDRDEYRGGSRRVPRSRGPDDGPFHPALRARASPRSGSGGCGTLAFDDAVLVVRSASEANLAAARALPSIGATMSQTAEVVVVGGGVHGCSLAYALAARGVKRVILLEQGALAHGASGRSSALVRMHYTNEWDARLAWASFPVFRHWAELMGGPPVFTHTGFVNVVAPEYAEALGGMSRCSAASASIPACSLPPTSGTSSPSRRWTTSGRPPTSPTRATRAAGRGGRIRAPRRELGAAVRPWTAVTAVRRSGRRVTGVETAAGAIDAGAVVVAAGAWAPRLCRELGVTLPARPKAIDTVAVTRPPALAQGHMVFIDNVQGSYFRTEAGGLTLVGVPCQEWDIDPDTASTGLPPHAAGKRAHPHAAHPRHGERHPRARLSRLRRLQR